MTAPDPLTYVITCIDTECPSPYPWMDTPGILAMTPLARGGGACSWAVTTADPGQLESALDEDGNVLGYWEPAAARELS